MLINLFDIFSGCGGLSYGLKQAGITPTWAIENWDPAIKTFSVNHPASIIYKQSATEILKRLKTGGTDLPSKGEVDILAGGPPCQGFSGINRYRNFEDKRNSMVEIFFEFVLELNPRIVVMENVNGILSLEGGSAVKNLMENLTKIDYFPKLIILQAGVYGVPQNRWRTFVFATHQNENRIESPKALHLFPKTNAFDSGKFSSAILRPPKSSDLFDQYCKFITVSDAISDLPEIDNGGNYEGEYLNKSLSNYQKELRLNSKKITNHQCSRLGPINLERVMHLEPNSGNGWIDLPNELKPKNLVRVGETRYKNRFGRLKWDYIFNTIMTKPEPYWGRVIHPEQNRVYSVRESARAQGFPDNFKFEGNLTERYKQIGNAVPPPLARSIGWEIRRSLGDNKVDEEINEYKSNFIDF